MYRYDDVFYDYINVGSVESASIVVPYVLEVIDVSSILDVGCGQGAWLSVWKRDNDIQVMGLDGSYVNPDKLLIDSEEFISADISNSFDLKRKFSLCQCLEVAEHIPEDRADILINNICAHADVVMFSAAPIGQGGENHVNEKPYSYWKLKFSERGFDMYDPIRPKLAKHREVKGWYKNNIFFFIKQKSKYSDKLSFSKISLESDIRDYSGLFERTIKYIVELLPVKAVTFLALCKKKVFVYMYRFRRRYNVWRKSLHCIG